MAKKDQARRRKALVTGATGFVGSHLVKRLVDEGWDVHTIIRPGSAGQNSGELRPPIHIHKHDGTTEKMLAIMKEVKPGIVFHLASLFLARHEAGDVVPLVRSNILFATQLAEAMVANKVNYLINTGTAWQHYHNQDYDPVCLYAATKQAFEAILKFYVETSPLKVINLKLFDTYGPNDQRPKLFKLLKKAARDQGPLAMSPGGQLLDLVFIDDVVDAYLLAAERILKSKNKKMEDFAVSSMRPIRLKELVKIYERIYGKELPIRWGGIPYREREVMVPWNKGKLLPGWRPEVPLEEGIKRTLNHGPGKG